MVFPVKKEDAPVAAILPKVKQEESVAPEIAKKPLFGNAISEGFYRLAKNFFFEHKLYRVLDIALWDDTTIYTFCNLWRIEKAPKGNAYFEYSLIKKAWFRMNPKNFPTLRIIPVGDLAAQLLKSVAGEVMHYFVHIGAIPKSNEVIALPDQFFIMKKVLGEHIKFVNKNGGSKILAKVLWGELIDRTILSQYCQVKPHRTSSFLNTYLHFYEHRRGLAKVMREHPNLIPLLSTWNSLLRRHEVWVRDLQYTSRNHYAWDSPLPDREIGRFTVKPLLTSDALYEEGEKMRHCIVSYEEKCRDGHYLAFALHDTKTDRDFTLGFYTEDQKIWEFDQIRSYCNSAASKKAIEVGKEVLSLLNREEPVADSNRV